MEKCQQNLIRELGAYGRSRDRDVVKAKVKYFFIGLLIGLIISAIIWGFM